MKESQRQIVRVLYTLIPAAFEEAEVLRLMDHLSVSEQSIYFNKLKPLARLQFLLGRLLIRSLCNECYPGEQISLCLTPFGKPYLKQKPLAGISIAHSDHMVVCALHTCGLVGIDVEFIRPVVLGSFQPYFLPKEWDFILNHTAPLRTFFDLWTRKEAVMKADGRGFGLNFSRLETLSDPVITELHSWHCTPIFLNEQFATTIAYLHGSGDSRVHLKQVDIAAFMTHPI